MSNQTISSDLVADLSIDEQQFISGGRTGTIKANGRFLYKGKRYPAEIDVKVTGLP
jgi:hypothetical protein